jgi:hypothetical protein
MNLPVRFAMGAAVVLLAAFIGIRFLPGGSTVGAGPGPMPTPTPTPTPMPIPVGSSPVLLGEPGTYLAGSPFPLAVTFTLPAGWSGNIGGPYATFLEKRAGGGKLVSAVSVTRSHTLYADPCNDRGSLNPQPGPTVDDLASALANLPGFDASSATQVTVDGYHGTQLTLTAPASFDGCALSSNGYRLFSLPLGGVYSFEPGQRTAFLILDVHGERLVISSDTYAASSRKDQAEVQAVLDSIHIGGPN